MENKFEIGLKKLELSASFNKIKLSILKIKKLNQIEPTRNWIKLFYNKFGCNKKLDYLNNYLLNAENNVK